MVVERPIQHGDPYDDVEDLSQIEIIPPHEMLTQLKTVNVAAPMVRYSKLAARTLFSRYETHITYTPMMLAKEYSRSEKARQAEFSTNDRERGIFTQDGRTFKGALVAQFAAKNSIDFANAVEMIHPYVDGVDLNCGCPQSWAYKEEIGSYLLRQPELVHDMVKQARMRVPSNFPISIKVRLDWYPENTSKLIQNAVHAGASYIGIHGRTRHQKDSDPVSLEGIKFAREEVKGAIPVIGNGDVFTLQDSVKMKEVTAVNAAMSARGLLENPALFAGYQRTPVEAVDRYMQLCDEIDTPWQIQHRQLSWMIEKHFPSRAQRVAFNSPKPREVVRQYLDDNRKMLFSSQKPITVTT